MFQIISHTLVLSKTITGLLYTSPNDQVNYRENLPVHPYMYFLWKAVVQAGL